MKKENEQTSFLTYIFAYMIVGFVIGIIVSVIASYSKVFYEVLGTVFANVWGIGFLILVIFITLLMQLIIHELGHLIFGWLTGYRFVSFRIFHWVWMKEGDQIRLKRFSIPGTSGQCLLLPPSDDPENFPYILYNLGGVFSNLILSTVAFILVFYVDSHHALLFLSMFIFMGLLFALLNGIPMRAQGISNDGLNTYYAFKDPEARRAMWVQLVINAEIASGKRYIELPREYFELKEASNLNNPLILTIALYKFNYLYDLGDYEKAAKYCDELLCHKEVVGVFQNELLCEQLFFELIDQCRNDVIESLYTKKLARYIRQTKHSITKLRLMVAFELLYHQDVIKATKYKAAFMRAIEKHPLKGEVVGELQAMDVIHQKAVERGILPSESLSETE